VKVKFTDDLTKFIPRKEDLSTTPTPPTKSYGLVCNPLAENLKNSMVGIADLLLSINMIWKGKVDFHYVSA